MTAQSERYPQQKPRPDDGRGFSGVSDKSSYRYEYLPVCFVSGYVRDGGCTTDSIGHFVMNVPSLFHLESDWRALFHATPLDDGLLRTPYFHDIVRSPLSYRVASRSDS